MRSLLDRGYRRIAGIVSTFIARAYCGLQGVRQHRSVRYLGIPVVELAKDSEIHLSQGVVLCSSSRFTALGVSHPVVLRTLRPGAKILIGRDVGISGGSICATELVTIGDETLMGADVVITDTDFHAVDSRKRRHTGSGDAACAPVVIGRNVFLGTGVKVLKGVTIGDNSVIGAGSVVASDIPSGVVAAGNPCRILRQLELGSS